MFEKASKLLLLQRLPVALKYHVALAFIAAMCVKSTDQNVP
jgi:hypothetical protein